ncbi:hypothetical protein ACFQHO_53165 [Actinomadura yumaensis]|uniref:hypothetical protein n=1 Tax=Actinomadura yumaensis TaxID=111807 RepID=UPI00360BF436
MVNPAPPVPPQALAPESVPESAVPPPAPAARPAPAAQSQAKALTLNIAPITQVEGGAKKQTNIVVPAKVAQKVRRERKRDDITHAMVVFRAVRSVVHDQDGFAALVTEYKQVGAETDDLLGVSVEPGIRKRKTSDRLMYNPAQEFENLLISLAEQCELSKAMFITLALVKYYGLKVDII